MLEVITEQHAEEAAFLWLLRDSATSEPHYDLADLAELDMRVEAHLRGLRVAGEQGWAICREAMEMEEPGEVFSASVLALEGSDGQRLYDVLEVAEQNQELFRPFVSAIGWVALPHAQKWLNSLARSKSLVHKRAALAGMSVRRLPIDSALFEASLASDDEWLRARALRAIGELGRRDLADQLSAEEGDDACQFWSSWSAVLLGDSAAAERLLQFVQPDSPFAYRALELAPRALEPAAAQGWLRDLAKDPATRRFALIGAGVTGDPVYIPTLVAQMADPEQARVAGEAFSTITGIDLDYDDLELEDSPAEFEAGPTEDPDDDDVDLDRDEDLPWPDQRLVQQWWQQHGGKYQAGTRYLCGQTVSDGACRSILASGLQRQRIAASLELARVGAPLFEWRAPGHCQEVALGLRQTRRAS